jgi:XTP/dITP diphosphohydrolase
MRTLTFATNNEKKAEEVRSVLGNGWLIKTLKESGIEIDIPEPHNTLEENAREKSSVIHQLTGGDCFSEDTGLEVETLNGEPGVRSARYAGEERGFDANIEKLLQKMQGSTDRRARFRTVISYIQGNNEFQFEGICNGIIIDEKRGNEGFGYDPVFVPDGDTRTFAEMSMADKNRFSHRKKAMDKLICFLQESQDSLKPA